MSGVFVAIEGVSGAGKTTCCRSLCHWLRDRGERVVDVRQGAEESDVGRELRRCVSSRAIAGAASPVARALLVAADRAQAVEDVVWPALQRGCFVVADRFHLTNLVHQGLVGGVGAHTVAMLETLAIGGLVPDLTIVLDCPAAVALSRISEPDFCEAEGLKHLEEIRAAYAVLARGRPSTTLVDSNRDVGLVFADVMELVHPLLQRGAH